MNRKIILREYNDDNDDDDDDEPFREEEKLRGGLLYYWASILNFSTEFCIMCLHSGEFPRTIGIPRGTQSGKFIGNLSLMQEAAPAIAA